MKQRLVRMQEKGKARKDVPWCDGSARKIGKGIGNSAKQEGTLNACFPERARVLRRLSSGRAAGEFAAVQRTATRANVFTQVSPHVIGSRVRIEVRDVRIHLDAKHCDEANVRVRYTRTCSLYNFSSSHGGVEVSRWLVDDGKWGNRMRNSLECDVSALHTTPLTLPYFPSLSLPLHHFFLIPLS